MNSGKYILQALAVLATALWLEGCSLAPGQNMDAGQLKNGMSEDNIRVELVPITPKMIMDEQQPKPSISKELLDYKPQPYRIGAGDILYVTVWDHPELTVPSGSQQQAVANGRLVRPNGEFFYPYVGNILVAGMSLDELSAKLTRDLAKFIDKPQVDVAILSYVSQKVLLSGAFKNAAPIILTSTPITLVEALGIGGVDQTTVDLSSLKLIRDGHEYILDIYALSRDTTDVSRIYLKDGDMIHLNYNDDKKVFVMGEVIHPTALVFHGDTLSLSDAISTAGGLNQNSADAGAIYVIRGMDDLEKQPAKVFQLSAVSTAGFALASRFRLQPQDVVYVGPTKISRWNRVISELLPTATALDLGASVAVDVHSSRK
jgi:polysaccharide export outer membrane protein